MRPAERLANGLIAVNRLTLRNGTWWEIIWFTVPVGFPLQIPPFAPLCLFLSPSNRGDGGGTGIWVAPDGKQISHFSFGLYMKQMAAMFDACCNWSSGAHFFNVSWLTGGRRRAQSDDDAPHEEACLCFSVTVIFVRDVTVIYYFKLQLSNITHL